MHVPREERWARRFDNMLQGIGSLELPDDLQPTRQFDAGRYDRIRMHGRMHCSVLKPEHPARFVHAPVLK